MRRFSTPTFALVLGLASCARTGQRLPTPATEAARFGPAEGEIVGTVNRFFDAMRARDTATLHSLIAPELDIVASVGAAGAPAAAIRRQTGAAFLAAIASSKVELRERMWAPEVRVDGDIAILWAPYDFHRGADFSHCGHDTFQFAREGGRWIVTALSYTVRPTGCPASPAP